MPLITIVSQKGANVEVKTQVADFSLRDEQGTRSARNGAQRPCMESPWLLLHIVTVFEVGGHRLEQKSKRMIML